MEMRMNEKISRGPHNILVVTAVIALMSLVAACSQLLKQFRLLLDTSLFKHVAIVSISQALAGKQ